MFPFLDPIQPSALPAVLFLVWLPVFLARRSGDPRWFFILASAVTLVFVAGPPLALGLWLIICGGYGLVELVARLPRGRGLVFLIVLALLHGGYAACFRLPIPGGYHRLHPAHAAGAFILFSGIGLTFFRLLSYFWDRVSRRAPALGLRDYLAYMTFFPQFRHGPIERAHRFASQLAAARRNWTPPDVALGLARVLLGASLLLLLRTALRHAVPPEYKNDLFTCFLEVVRAPERLNLPQLLLLIHLPALVLYLIESSAAHIQLGVARAFGVRGSENFRLPVLSRSPTDVWRRWNITLSLWLRDYAFRPLARARRLRYAALVLTFMYAGLVHGPALRHVIWGVYMGVSVAAYELCVHLLVRRRCPQPDVAPPPPAVTRGRWRFPPAVRALGIALGWLLTLHWASISVLIFLDPRDYGLPVLRRYWDLLTGG